MMLMRDFCFKIVLKMYMREELFTLIILRCNAAASKRGKMILRKMQL